MPRPLRELEDKIAYWFADRTHLVRALTHATLSNEDQSRPPNNKSLGFLGDAVLELAVREELFERRDTSTPGPLSLAADEATRDEHLTRVAARHDLDGWVRAGEGEKENVAGKDRRLADAFEALLGAIYLDSKGSRDAMRVALRLLAVDAA